jgi:hypothetical protein
LNTGQVQTQVTNQTKNTTPVKPPSAQVVPGYPQSNQGGKTRGIKGGPTIQTPSKINLSNAPREIQEMIDRLEGILLQKGFARKPMDKTYINFEIEKSGKTYQVCVPKDVKANDRFTSNLKLKYKSNFTFVKSKFRVNDVNKLLDRSYLSNKICYGTNYYNGGLDVAADENDSEFKTWLGNFGNVAPVAQSPEKVSDEVRERKTYLNNLELASKYGFIETTSRTSSNDHISFFHPGKSLNIFIPKKNSTIYSARSFESPDFLEKICYGEEG